MWTRSALLIYIARAEDWSLAGPDGRAVKLSTTLHSWQHRYDESMTAEVTGLTMGRVSSTAQGLQGHIYDEDIL